MYPFVVELQKFQNYLKRVRLKMTAPAECQWKLGKGCQKSDGALLRQAYGLLLIHSLSSLGLHITTFGCAPLPARGWRFLR